jgi:hypothetical protein
MARRSSDLESGVLMSGNSEFSSVSLRDVAMQRRPPAWRRCCRSGQAGSPEKSTALGERLELMQKWTVIGCLLSSLPACSGQEWTRVHNGTDDDFEREQRACMALSEQVVFDKTGRLSLWADDERVQKCLEDGGWHRSAQPAK